MEFTSIYHLINRELLIECHKSIDGNKAVGIDKVTKAEYETNLEENIECLVDRLKRKAYKPKPARRVMIPKDNGKMRPLNVYCYEDKIVQEAVRKLLESIYEPLFYDEMMGFRPNRGCHDALKKLNVMIEQRYTNYILDADIKGFFDHLNHEWIMKFIKSKIKDPNFCRLISRMLKSGVMENFEYQDTEEGSGQGSLCSPIIANIYMHYVLIWWYKEKMQPYIEGFSGMVVYADDFVMCFQHKKDAERFCEHLNHRMNYFGLELENDKTRLIPFGKLYWKRNKELGTKTETFTFLGFTHYCSNNKNGNFRVKRKTSRKKFAKKCKEINKTIRELRPYPIKQIIRRINQILIGYYHYYGITDNYDGINRFYHVVRKRLFHWLNRRSQRNSYNWDGFVELLKQYPLVTPKIYVNIYDNC